MNKIWQFSNSHCANRQQAYYLSIFIFTFSWTFLPFCISMAGCLLLQTDLLKALSISLTICGLSGIFIGFIGSLLYLLRRQ